LEKLLAIVLISYRLGAEKEVATLFIDTQVKRC